MKKLLSITLTICMVVSLLALTPLPAFAATEGIYTFTVSNGEATITYCNPYASGAITIPSTLIGFPVTAIGDRAFYSCPSLTSVTIPDSVTSIGDRAFYWCSKLTSVTIPDSVTSIGDEAFYDCESLTNIKVANSNKYYSSVNGNLFNKNKTNLIQYAIGQTNTFYTIPDSVTSIGASAFYNCYRLTSVTIGNGVTSIGDRAFSSCYSLTSVTIPDSVTSIGDWAFSSCSSLTSVTIGNGVTSIGDRAFYYCKSLTNIKVADSNKYYSSVNGNLFNKNKTNLIQYAIGKTNTFYTIPDSVTLISDGAFSWCRSLTSVTIPDSVTSIGVDAFSWCDSLTSVTIPDSVTSIGEDAFSSCDNLTSVTIPDSVTSIGASAFSYCYRLTSVTIPDSVTSIGDRTFSDCYSFTSVTIPDSVTSIGDWAFSSCSSLTSVTIPDSVTSISYGAFYDCKSLTDVYYFGSESQWNKIYIGWENDDLLNATIHFKSSVKITSFTSSTVTAKVSGVTAENAKAFFIVYNENGAFLQAQIKDVTKEMVFEDVPDGAKCKILIWDKNLNPICKTDDISLK